MKNGMIDGACWFYNQGRLAGEGIMTGQSHDPVKNGSWKAYFKNGRLKYEGVFVMGVRNGQFKEYYSIGTIKAAGEYVNDKRTGNWIFFVKDGKTVDNDKSGLYVMGKLTKK